MTDEPYDPAARDPIIGYNVIEMLRLGATDSNIDEPMYDWLFSLEPEAMIDVIGMLVAIGGVAIELLAPYREKTPQEMLDGLVDAWRAG